MLTLIDCLFREGFLNPATKARSLTQGRQIACGVGVGAIATMLGVGGSVMTVPLMRRLGSSMKTAVVMANPLSIPVAMVGTLLYGALSVKSHVELGSKFVGYVDIVALGVLVATGFLGIMSAGDCCRKFPTLCTRKPICSSWRWR